VTEPPPSSGAQSERYRSYALGLLLVVYVFNFIDRQILTILLEPIKQDLELSDTALGFLTGFAFAFFYTFAGIPIARWAASGSRTTIIALGLFLWSAATALTGFARGFVHLAAARVGVGLGEAACSPPAHSLISDYFPPERRATALGIYALGIPIGGAIGTLAGGWINELFDWRTAFLVVGLPGVALALVTRLTLREPPRGRFDAPAAAGAQRESIREVFAFLWGLRSFRHMSFAAALHAFVGYGAAAFAPSFLIRIHDFSTGELSTWLAGIAITFGSLGTYLGGSFTDGLAQRDVHRRPAHEHQRDEDHGHADEHQRQPLGFGRAQADRLVRQRRGRHPRRAGARFRRRLPAPAREAPHPPRVRGGAADPPPAGGGPAAAHGAGGGVRDRAERGPAAHQGAP